MLFRSSCPPVTLETHTHIKHPVLPYTILTSVSWYMLVCRVEFVCVCACVCVCVCVRVGSEPCAWSGEGLWGRLESGARAGVRVCVIPFNNGSRAESSSGVTGAKGGARSAPWGDRPGWLHTHTHTDTHTHTQTPGMGPSLVASVSLLLKLLH